MTTEQKDPVRASLQELVRMLRGYACFPIDLLPALQAAEQALAAGTHAADSQP